MTGNILKKIETINAAKNLGRIFMGILFGVSLCGAGRALASVPLRKTTVIYFGQQSPEDFDKKIKPVFMSVSCKTCEIINSTPYTKEGQLDIHALKERVDSLPEEISFVFFDFNLKFTDEYKELVETLNRKVEKGLVVVGSAGSPKASDSSSPLSRTVLGHVNSALIIGELGDRDRLMPTAFYGPEMLTAIRPPKDKIGQGYSPLIFAANLAEHWQKRPAQEWTNYLKKKKASSRKIWLDMNDLF